MAATSIGVLSVPSDEAGGKGVEARKSLVVGPMAAMRGQVDASRGRRGRRSFAPDGLKKTIQSSGSVDGDDECCEEGGVERCREVSSSQSRANVGEGQVS